ncbi:MAG: hypothetical protein CMP23_12570 [Rickettsiales bacterium]|nr:hypothetical protein [Rickettsiales bacterium]
MSKNSGRILRSSELTELFRHKELSRRRFVARAATIGAGLPLAAALPGCTTSTEPEPTAPPTNYLVGMASGDQYTSTLRAALNETVGREQLGFIETGETVYLKVNSNSGDYYPYSTRPKMVQRLTEWALEQGAGRVIVGDRSFWGDPNTYNNLVANGIVEASEEAGAELVVFDDDSVDWVEFSEDDNPDWIGGFRYPLPVVEADHIINLPVVKTHFISTFTMALKNLIGLVHADDRRREGNLDVHITAGNKLYRQIAQLNQRITPTLNILDGWEAVTRGGPTIGGNSEEGEPGLLVVSTDRIATDVVGLAILKRFAHSSEEVHDFDIWENPQIVEAVEAGIGINGPEDFEISAPSVSDLEDYLDLIV